MQTLISKTTRDGKPLQITFDGETFIATVAGRALARHILPGAPVTVAGERVHVFAGKVGLTLAEGAILRAAYDARPRRAAPVTRESLVATYQGLCDAQDAAYQRAHDREDARAMAIRESYEDRIEAARQAIVAYDAAHPEETAARQRAAAESLERNRWM